MPIDLITGQPGNGKTLRMIELLMKERDKPSEQRRYMVNIGIEGLAPDLVDADMADGKNWNLVDFDKAGVCACHDGTGQVLEAEGIERKIRQGTKLVENPVYQEQMDIGRPHSHVIPDGAIIYVDEAWKSFGHLEDASRRDTPRHVLALAEHRHRGLDFVWTTQQANQIYPFVRGLIASHTHVIRKFSTSFCTLYTWGELCEDTKSQTQRDKALSVSWSHPKSVFDKYKSATQHTIKAKIPWRVVLIPICLVAGIVLFWWVYATMKAKGQGDVTTQDESGVAGSSATAGPADRPMTAQEWAARLQPRIVGIHGSQPVFDGRKVKSEPATFCAVSGPGLDGLGKHTPGRCRCFTEQATVIEGVLPAVCRRTARYGQYDPFRAVASVQRGAPGGLQKPTPPPTAGEADATLGESFDTPLVIPGAVVLP